MVILRSVRYFHTVANAAKIACSIDADLLARARALKQYVEAYRDHPASAADIAAARKSGRRVIAHVAWEDE